jgi:translation initiation factor IF-3
MQSLNLEETAKKTKNNIPTPTQGKNQIKDTRQQKSGSRDIRRGPQNNLAHKINHMIKASEVRVVLPETTPLNGEEHNTGSNSEVMPLSKALELSLKYGVDLIEIAPKANPPVCKLMDYGKFLYREQKAHKKDKHTKSKEIGCHVNIAENDLNTKIKHAEEFLHASHQVVFKVQFRGREAVHKEIGIQLLETIQERLTKSGTADGAPKINGKLAMLRFSPKKQSKS